MDKIPRKQEKIDKSSSTNQNKKPTDAKKYSDDLITSKKDLYINNNKSKEISTFNQNAKKAEKLTLRSKRNHIEDSNQENEDQSKRARLLEKVSSAREVIGIENSFDLNSNIFLNNDFVHQTVLSQKNIKDNFKTISNETEEKINKDIISKQVYADEPCVYSDSNKIKDKINEGISSSQVNSEESKMSPDKIMDKIENDSSVIRNTANEIFKTIKPEQSLEQIKQNVHKCINLYEISLKLANDRQEKFKSQKNLALSYFKVVDKMSNGAGYSEKNFEEFFYYASFSINHYMAALKLCDESKVLNELEARIIQLIEKIETTLSIYHIHKPNLLMPKLLKLASVISWDHHRIMIKIILAIIKKYFTYGIFCYDNNKHKESSSAFENCLQFIREALFNKRTFIMNNEDILNDFYEIDELNELEDSVKFYLIRCKASILISLSDHYYSLAIFEDESVDMDLVLEAVDYLRQAMMILEDDENKLDIELIAILCSKLGKIFYRIYKNINKGENLVRKSINYGMSLHPKNVSLENWYREASSILSEISKIKEKEEKEKTDEERKKYLEELKSTIEDLDKRSKNESIESFIKFILEKHPPIKNLKYDVDAEKEKSNIRKVIMKVISFYHPDKFSNEDLKKKILMEEITKILTTKHEYFK